MTKYKRKTDEELAVEFRRVYRVEPTPSMIEQFRKSQESASMDVLMEKIAEIEAGKVEKREKKAKLIDKLKVWVKIPKNNYYDDKA